MPIPVLTVSEMRAWERATWATGGKEDDVIRQVGQEIAKQVHQLSRPGHRVLILAGRGNNGADALAAEPNLTDRGVDRLVVTEPTTASADLEAALAKSPALIVDGLFGIGLNRPLSAPWRHLIDRVNQAQLPVLAVDVPSGLNADTGDSWGSTIRATTTLTVGAPKTGLLANHAQASVGRLEVARQVGLVGEPASAGDLWWTFPGDFSDWPGRRESTTHKGSFGHAVILAGSVGFAGAAVLAGRAAGRARPGLVSVLTTPATWLPVACQLAAAMVHPFAPDHAVLKQATTILAGPGLAATDLPPEMQTEVVRLWCEFPGPLVVDASALDWLPAGKTVLGTRVLTPHPGEAGRLLGISAAEVQRDRLKALRHLAQRFNALIVLKGHQTLIGTASGPVFVNPVGNPGLAQGGTGDVLGGFLAGLLAQPKGRQDPLTAARFAAWQHGAVADRLESRSLGWTAEELATALHV